MKKDTFPTWVNLGHPEANHNRFGTIGPYNWLIQAWDITSPHPEWSVQDNINLFIDLLEEEILDAQKDEPTRILQEVHMKGITYLMDKGLYLEPFQRPYMSVGLISTFAAGQHRKGLKCPYHLWGSDLTLLFGQPNIREIRDTTGSGAEQAALHMVITAIKRGESFESIIRSYQDFRARYVNTPSGVSAWDWFSPFSGVSGTTVFSEGGEVMIVNHDARELFHSFQEAKNLTDFIELVKKEHNYGKFLTQAYENIKNKTVEELPRVHKQINIVTGVIHVGGGI